MLILCMGGTSPLESFVWTGGWMNGWSAHLYFQCFSDDSILIIVFVACPHRGIIQYLCSDEQALSGMKRQDNIKINGYSFWTGLF